MTGKIKFVKRGGALAGRIPKEDLAAHEDGNSSPNPLSTSRAHDLELPLELSVLYINPDADYQQGIQTSKRQISSGVGKTTVSLPIVFNDTKAKQVADTLHYLAWVERTTYRVELSRKWSHLEPTDIIEVEYSDNIFLMRIISKSETPSGIVSLDCVAEDTSVYTQSGLGASVSTSTVQVIRVPVQTIIYLLDLPPLREEDDDPGIYIAASGIRSGWTGCTLFKSNDGGTTYAESISITEQAIVGNTTTVLGNYYGGNTIDELNYVTVKMLSGSLSSVTELALLNGANYALLGNEIIQYKTAELVATNTYKISGLLRGRKGTEIYQSTHSIGERFLVINTLTWYRLPLQLSDIGVQKIFKPVSFGMPIQQTASVPFTSSGEALECLSPILPGAGRNSANDITISYVRRDRLDAGWRSYVDASMSETTEAYEIDIYDNSFSTVLRTISSTTSYATYTSANQVTDFGLNINRVNTKIYQLSSAVGRGAPLIATLEMGNIDRVSTKWRLQINSLADPAGYLFPVIKELSMFTELNGTNRCVGGVANASHNPGTAANAFDGSSATQWSGAGWVGYPQWLQYTFDSPKAIVQFSIKPSDSLFAIKSFNLQYYESSTWKDAYIALNETGWGSDVVRTYTI